MKKKYDAVICCMKSVRQARGFTQNQLAERVGVKRQAIYDIESGRYLPNTALALRLAKHLGCKVEDLFTEQSPEQDQPVTVIEDTDADNSRVAVAKVRERLVAYPLAGRHALYDGFHPADGLLDSEGSRVRLLCSEKAAENSVLLLGCDPAFSILKEHVFRKAPEARIYCRFASSHRALESLGAGHAHIAGTHLHNVGNTEANVLLAKKILSGSDAMLIGFSFFEEGLMVAPGNPLGIRKVDELAQKKIRFANREPGAALRVLLDDCLDKAGIPHTAVNGYSNNVSNHFEGAQMVANHFVDAVLGLRAVADAFGLDFVPIKSVRCDLVIPGDLTDHPSVRIILDILQTRRLRQELSALPGYDVSHTGRIISILE